MAGSKKGERRGNAKPGASKRPVIRSAGEPPRKPKGYFRKPQLAQEDYMRQIVAIVNGTPGGATSMPREAMLRAQHFFEEEADGYRAYKRGLLEQIARCDSPEMLAALDAQLSDTDAKIYELVRTASDMAHKAAPFYHPRYSAIAIAEQTRSAPNMMQLIMEEIDDASRGRPSWQRQLKLVGGTEQ